MLVRNIHNIYILKILLYPLLRFIIPVLVPFHRRAITKISINLLTVYTQTQDVVNLLIRSIQRRRKFFHGKIRCTNTLTKSSPTYVPVSSQKSTSSKSIST